MFRLLSTPRWLIRTAIAVAAVAVCLRLGWWQWGRSLTTQSAQNLGYALQWPLFAAFTVFAWWRMLRLELRPPADGSRAEERSELPAPLPLPESARPKGAGRDKSADDALTAYNRYLRSLYLQDQQDVR